MFIGKSSTGSLAPGIAADWGRDMAKEGNVSAHRGENGNGGRSPRPILPGKTGSDQPTVAMLELFTRSAGAGIIARGLAPGAGIGLDKAGGGLPARSLGGGGGRLGLCLGLRHLRRGNAAVGADHVPVVFAGARAVLVFTGRRQLHGAVKRVVCSGEWKVAHSDSFRKKF